MRFDKIIIRNTTPSETKILLEKNGPLNRKKTLPNWKVSQTVDKVYFMDAVYSLFFYNRFMKTNARSDSYDV